MLQRTRRQEVKGSKHKEIIHSQAQGLTPVIPDTQEIEIRRNMLD
jgi:hypothetical protein